MRRIRDPPPEASGLDEEENLVFISVFFLRGECLDIKSQQKEQRGKGERRWGVQEKAANLAPVSARTKAMAPMMSKMTPTTLPTTNATRWFEFEFEFEFGFWFWVGSLSRSVEK